MNLNKSEIYTQLNIKKCLAILVVFALALSIACFPLQAYASVESHRKKADEALKAAEAQEARAAELAREISTLDGKAEEYRNKAASYEPQIEEAVAKTDQIVSELDKLQDKKAVLVSDIASTTAELESKKEQLADRAAESYRSGEVAIFMLLFEADSITDFLARSEIVSRVLQQNAEITSELKIAQRKLNNDKTQLEELLDETEKKKQEAKDVADGLVNLRNNMESAARQVDNIESQKTALMEESQENAERLRAMAQQEESTARALEAQLAALAKKQNTGQEGTSTQPPVSVSTSGFAWPTPGFTRITSPYGWRMHPVLGYNRMHNGIDIGRNGSQPIDGAAIVAAQSGRVITAGYLNGYGNTVIIDHGNGVSSVYAHQQAGGIKVGVGQSVKRGQRIGTVGSTGYSTGPHLHFEVRVNGAAQNPMNYL